MLRHPVRRTNQRPLRRQWTLPLALMLLAAPPASVASTPTNGWIVWASTRGGTLHDIYLMRSDGTQVTRLTQTGARNPMWSPDGSWIAYETVPAGRTRVMRWDKSDDKEIFAGPPLFWMLDGSGVVCRTGDDFKLVNPDTGAVTHLFSKADFSKIGTKEINPGAITRDGRYLLAHSDRYRQTYAGDNGTFTAYHAAIVLDRQDPSKVYYFGQGCEPTAPPTGGLIYHVCGGGACQGTSPDIYQMQVSDLATRASYQAEMAHSDPDWGHEYFPRISTDGLWLTYGATTGCHDHDTCDYEVFVHKLGAGGADRTRLTTNSANDQWPHMFLGTLWQRPVPQLTLSPTSLSFSALTGGQDPAPQEVAVTNSGAGTLAAVTTSISYGAGAGWLAITRTGTGNAQKLSNAVTAQGLPSGTYTATVDVAASGAGAKQYKVTVAVTDQIQLARIEVTGSAKSCFPGGAVSLTARPLDQNDAPFAATIAWRSNGGGALSPASSGGAVTMHTTAFACGATEGTFQITAESGAVSGAAVVVVAAPLSLPVRINSGSNDYPVEGWLADDAFVSGGADWINPNDVEVSGVPEAGPPALYKSVRHQSPHSYRIPVADGRYLLRLHFADAYTNRSMTYLADGVQILSGFDPSSEAGGVNRALVKSFEVDVVGADGLLIEATSAGDVFEAGIELLPVAPAGGESDGGTEPLGPGPSPDQSGPSRVTETQVTGTLGCSAGPLLPTVGASWLLWVGALAVRGLRGRNRWRRNEANSAVPGRPRARRSRSR
ncbi:MAG: PD40 domain-containing protein [Myxococcales bacterium]|nr:PD40 domain-containing protein [Myxococcales bacterium]